MSMNSVFGNVLITFIPIVIKKQAPRMGLVGIAPRRQPPTPIVANAAVSPSDKKPGLPVTVTGNSNEAD